MVAACQLSRHSGYPKPWDSLVVSSALGFFFFCFVMYFYCDCPNFVQIVSLLNEKHIMHVLKNYI